MGVISRLNDWFWRGTDNRIDKKLNAQKAEFNKWLYRPPGKEVSKNFTYVYRMTEYELWHSENVTDLVNFYAFYPNQPNEQGSRSRMNWYEWVHNVPNLPKLHIPIAGLITTTMNQLLFGSGDVTIQINGNEKLNKRLQKILKENDIQNFMKRCGDLESFSGTIGITVSINPNVSSSPIVNVYPASKLDYEEYNGRIISITTTDEFGDCIDGMPAYRLFTTYSKGKIDYALFKGTEPVPLSEREETQNLSNFAIDNAPLLAVWKQNSGNSKEFHYTLLGASDYEGVIDTFHLCDELYSTMNAYLRRTRPSFAVDETLFPIDPTTRRQKMPKEWELDMIPLAGRGVGTGNNLNSNGVMRDIPKVDFEPYEKAILRQLQLIFIKLGINTSYINLDLDGNSIGANTSSQAIYSRAMSTHNVRNVRVSAWKTALEKLVKILLVFDDVLHGVGKIETEVIDEIGNPVKAYAYKAKNYDDLEVVVSFGDLDAEDFVTRLDTAIKGIAGKVMNTDMGIEYALKYKYTKDEISENQRKIKEEIQENLRKEQRARVDNMHKTTDVTASSIKR